MTTMTLAQWPDAFRGMFPDLLGQRLLVALSGGADSVALLHLLHLHAHTLQVYPAAAHVHHRLRGAEADADAAFCRALCAQLGVPLQVCHLPRPTPPRGCSPEAWWRRERYRLLGEEAEGQGCAAVLTAHTLDDQAETVLLKLLTGGGPRAVAGIRRRAGRVVRPLLGVRRAELRAFLRERGAEWREDASNRDPTRPRAWLRLVGLPLLEGHFPQAGAHLAAFAEALARDEEVLSRQLAGTARWPTVGGAVPVGPLAALPEALLARWVLQLAAHLPLAEPPSRVQLQLVSDMVREGRPRAVDLGRRWVLQRRQGSLVLLPPPLPPFGPLPAGREVTLPGGWRATLADAVPAAARLHAWLHPRVLRAQPCWRSLRPGEGWPAMGIPRLAAALKAQGVPAPWRRAWPLLEASGTMIWVPALGVAAGWEAEQGEGVAVALEEPWPCRWR